VDFNMVEIVLLGGLAIIIFGPEKLPELARKAAGSWPTCARSARTPADSSVRNWGLSSTTSPWRI
jgi:Sec-independent protein translocase protein TatA